MSWIRCTRRNPCGLCGKADWCCSTTDGATLCMRVEPHDVPPSFRVIKVPVTGGVIVRPADDADPPPASYAPASVNRKAGINWSPAYNKFLAAIDRGRLEELSRELSIPSGFLQLIGIGWSQGHSGWTFPMYNEDREITGIRLRLDSGRKSSVRGSRNGVFLPALELAQPILIAEGPTDSAALMSLGYAVIGRPSCVGGQDIIQDMTRDDDVVIVSDSDSPGRQGANQLASILIGTTKSVRVIEPSGSANDARDWVAAGATRELVDMVIHNAIDRRRAHL